MTLGLGDLAFVGSLSAGGAAYDADAQDYINRVIAADAAAGDSSGLEVGVQDAYNAFVVGCKADGIWTLIKAACILAGARTRLGSLTPLVGVAPTSINFVDADYNRKTGWKGNGTDKAINTNRNNNADLRNNSHMACYIHTKDSRTAAQYAYMGMGAANGGDSNLMQAATSTNAQSRFKGQAVVTGTTPVGTGLLGVSRSDSTQIVLRTAQASTTLSSNSFTPTSGNIQVFSRTANFTDARINFYSIGEALDLALLEARVATLINAIAAAIP